MRLLLSIAILLLLFNKSLAGQETINGTILHDNIERSYILYVPEKYSAANAAPLVFNFHGYTSNASSQMNYGDFRPIADTAGFLIVHPMGLTDVTGTTHFNVGWGTSSFDDVGFTSDLIDSISAQYNVDQKRIYSTGMSNGGFMSYELACQLSDRIAAIASVTGSMSPFTYENCNPSRAVPILEIHGTSDQVVPYLGAGHTENIDKVIEYWVANNNTNSTPIEMELPDLNVSDGSTVIHFQFLNEETGVHVELMKIIGGGHTWPNTQGFVANTNQDIDANVEVWNFFSRYNLDGVLTDAHELVKEENTITVFPNPSEGNFFIEQERLTGTLYEIYNTNGNIVQAGPLQNIFTEVNGTHLPEGMYFVKVGSSIKKLILQY